MIKHTQNGAKHEVTAMTEKAARFLNSFVGRIIVMNQQEWNSVKMEMAAHKVWVMGE